LQFNYLFTIRIIKIKFTFFISFLFLLLTISSAEEPIVLHSPNHPNSLLAEAVAVEGTSDISETTRRRRHSRYIPPKKMSYKSQFDIQYDTLLSNDVRYRIIKWGGRYKHTFHAVEVDLNNRNIYLKVLKAHKLNNHLDKLQNIVSKFNNKYTDTILAAINANFWRAGSNYPIGPTVMDGEIIEMHQYKDWTSGLFDAWSRLYIDNFKITGKYFNKHKISLPIDNVNRRRDSTGLVMYNQFAGEAIPFISPMSIGDEIEAAIDEAAAEAEFADSTDFEIDSLHLLDEIITAKQMANREFNYYKASCRYLNAPALNKTTHAVVERVSKGVLTMPINGFIISYGGDNPKVKLPKPGDTISIHFRTNKHDNIIFFNAVSGTPRLVRDSSAVHEARKEGSKSKRFINMQLPRTAIGTNKDRTKLYLVVVESSALSEKKTGASLYNMSQIMNTLGATDAMNLDGGGSSIMVIDGKNVLLPSKPDAGRKISVGIGIILIR